jgi:hypothetical protein
LIVVVIKPSSSVATAITTLAAVASTSLGFISGRISTRDERGASGDRPRS